MSSDCATADKAENHPCFSKDAHQYARIHLPVAPACNIQCNYCNRKFDCSNESRPGVVSKLRTPAAAAKHFQAVKARMPNLSVVGIAGPGDPLANPAATEQTLRAIRKIDADVHLCVSTNGLNLPDMVPMLKDVGVHHLTVTMNTLQPEIAQYLYAWVYANGRRLRGLEAAHHLIEQQKQGIALAINSGILVKVNTVLVPTVNSKGIEELASFIQAQGAFVHNIMPLISEPEHGTAFGLAGVKGPTNLALQEARLLAGTSVDQMTHCQQCRADAVGTLDQANSCPTTSPSLKRVAIASKDGKTIDTHFGHAKRFYIFDVFEERVQYIESRAVDQYCHGLDGCDESPNQNGLFRVLQDCQQVLCTRIGAPPKQILHNIGCQATTDFAYKKPLDALETVRKALNQTDLKEVC